VTQPLRDLATTRLASLCLNRRGRPRGLSFDDYLIRAGLILDLAVCGALSQTEDAVELDHARAAAHGLADAAAQADEGDGSLLDWLDWGELGFDEWAATLTAAGIWQLRPWSLRYPLRSFADDERERADADRAAGRRPLRGENATPQTLAVLALGSVSGLLGKIAAPPSWVLADLGEARWAAELVVDRLVELRVRMRSIGRAVD
jgi:hypothetical protein